MRSKCYDDYLEERTRLKKEEVDHLLEGGRIWNQKGNLASLLGSRGVIIFPHTFLHSCGSYIAAAVLAALDSGKEEVVVLGVLHSITEAQLKARGLEREKKDFFHLGLRGIYGPELENKAILQDEYSLLSFLFLWDEAVKRRNKKPPKLYVRYPYLANREPETMPGMQELEEIAKNAAIVATSDLCHHGVAYGLPKKDALPLGPKADAFAHQNIADNIALLSNGSYDSYYQHCIRIGSDSYDVGSCIKYLRGPLNGKVLDVTVVDASSLYSGSPAPSWCAASLVSLAYT